MKEITKSKIVFYTVHQTSDGKEFEDKQDALLHENILSGKTKKCDKCNGNGYINERWEDEYVLKSGEHFATEKMSQRKSDVCPTCKGNKFLNLKWV